MGLKTFIASLVLASSVANAATYSYPSAPGKTVTSYITTTGNGLPNCSPESEQYSGFVTINATLNKQYFYWAFGPRTRRPDAPVILWMSGGPGCSSSLAALIENGPCFLNKTTGELYNNPYGWNKDAFLIFIDQPAGVGFSTSDAAGYASNEEEVSEDMYWFLQEFFNTAHPNFMAKNNEFFVFGESYAGHYAPATAHKIFKRNQQPAQYKHINLAGLGVGNGLTNPYTQYQFYSETAYEYCIEKLGKPCVSLETAQFMNSSLPGCLDLINQCNADPAGFACTSARASCNAGLLIPYTITGKNTYDIRKNCEGDLCYNLGELAKFMNKPEVQDAFGVPRQTWASCNMLVNLAFMADWFANFEYTVRDMLNGPNPIRTMIYVGEMDFVCNLKGNKAWLLNLEWNQKAAFNRAADVPYFPFNTSSPSGLVRSVAGPTGPMHLTFAQVFEAGHMVPMDQPAVMYDMLDRFVNNKGWGMN